MKHIGLWPLQQIIQHDDTARFSSKGAFWSYRRELSLASAGVGQLAVTTLAFDFHSLQGS